MLSKTGISRSKAGSTHKKPKQMEQTAYKALQFCCDCKVSITVESSNFYEQWLRLSSSFVAKSLFSSTDKKVDQIYSSERKYCFCFRREVSNQSESRNRLEPGFLNIVRKGRDILTEIALVQMEFLTK